MSARRRRGNIPETSDKKNATKNLQGSESLFPLCFKLILSFAIVVLVFLAVIWTWSPVIPVDIVQPTLPAYNGVLEINDVIERGVKIIDGFGAGPESVAMDKDGILYTGFEDGRIVRVGKGKNGAIGEGEIKVIVDSGMPGVKPITKGVTIGRPLGIRLDDNLNILYVMDTEFGLYSLNLKTLQKESLVEPSDVEPPLGCPNDLTLSKNNHIIYFTDSSSAHTISEMGLEALEGRCYGRVIKYDLISKVLEIVSTGLCMANGIQLTSDESTLLVTEMLRFRVLYIDIASKKIKKTITFPGLPDNIRPSASKNRYWVSCIRITKTFYTSMPSKLLRKLLGLFDIGPSVFADFSNFGLVVEIDGNGNMVSSIHDHHGKIAQALSQATVAPSGDLILSSVVGSYLIKIAKDDILSA